MIPRIVIAGTSSGAGKTTIATGLIAALATRGLRIAPFKVGPDFIDPSYHALASSRYGRNLDAFLSGPGLIAPLFLHGAHGAELAVIEGVMGLFDGASGQGELASTAQIAKLLRAPVLLVVDATSMARSVAAIVHGFRSFDPGCRLAGVIFNRVGSASHAQMLADAVATLPDPPVVLGCVPRDERVAMPERHLGLVPAGERRQAARRSLAAVAAVVREAIDLDAVIALARSAGPLAGPRFSPAEAVAPACHAGSPAAGVPARQAGSASAGAPTSHPTRARIALARGPAFSFHYPENLELLAAAGAELCEFDPTCDRALPAGTQALIFAGGFPEVYADQLAANVELKAAVARFVAGNGPVLAECGGLLYLGQRLGEAEMCGVLPISAQMTDRLTLGYRQGIATTATPWCTAGSPVRGHEFHYSQVLPTAVDGPPPAAFSLQRASGAAVGDDGVVSGSVQAGYLHMHWAAFPQLAAGFVAAAAQHRPAVDRAAARQPRSAGAPSCP